MTKKRPVNMLEVKRQHLIEEIAKIHPNFKPKASATVERLEEYFNELKSALPEGMVWGGRSCHVVGYEEGNEECMNCALADSCREYHEEMVSGLAPNPEIDEPKNDAIVAEDGESTATIVPFESPGILDPFYSQPLGECYLCASGIPAKEHIETAVVVVDDAEKAPETGHERAISPVEHEIVPETTASTPKPEKAKKQAKTPSHEAEWKPPIRTSDNSVEIAHFRKDEDGKFIYVPDPKPKEKGLIVFRKGDKIRLNKAKTYETMIAEILSYRIKEKMFRVKPIFGEEEGKPNDTYVRGPHRFQKIKEK